MYQEYKDLFLICYTKYRVLHITSFYSFPGVLEGLGSSGKLTGTISADPGTSPTSYCQKPGGGGGNFFVRLRYGRLDD